MMQITLFENSQTWFLGHPSVDLVKLTYSNCYRYLDCDRDPWMQSGFVVLGEKERLDPVVDSRTIHGMNNEVRP